jgi:hypothetical protein
VESSRGRLPFRYAVRVGVCSHGPAFWRGEVKVGSVTESHGSISTEAFRTRLGEENAVPVDPIEESKAERELLWAMHEDVRTHSRHAETLRAEAVSVVIVVASALIAVVTADEKINHSDIGMTATVAVLGLFGLAFAASYTELYLRNWLRAKKLRDILDDRYIRQPKYSFAKIYERSDGNYRFAELIRKGDKDKKAEQSFRRYDWVRKKFGTAQRFWLGAPILVTVVGNVLTIIAIINKS